LPALPPSGPGLVELLEGGVRADGERVDHHAGLEFFDLAHLRRLLIGLQVRRLADIVEIAQLKAQYCRCVDTKDWDGFADLFTEGAEYVEHVLGNMHGREEIRTWDNGSVSVEGFLDSEEAIRAAGLPRLLM